MILSAVLGFAATSYVAWYLERFEMAAVYPFDATYETPAAAGEPRLTETRFQTQDGHVLVLWQSPAKPGRATVLYFPGNAGGLKDRVNRFHLLIDRGFGLVALAYRGSSGSTGAPNETVLTADAEAVARAQTARPLVLYGESLGTALAIKLAADGIGDAVVLEAPFTSITDLVAAQFPAEDLRKLVTQRWDSDAVIARVSQPLLVIHGTDDRTVPIAMGRRIFDLAGSGSKAFVEVARHGHHGLWTPEMQKALYDFLIAQ